jgi:hypothetical protein
LILPRAKSRRLRRLIADTGAGSDRASFELVLTETDCRRLGGVVMGQAQLGGAYSGWFNVFMIDIQIPSLQFVDAVTVAGVPRVPHGFDGIACFKFLNRFHYGNFGDANNFGLEQP